MPNVKQEPSANARQAARAFRDIFLALIEEGFTEHQALVILGQMMASSQMGDKDE